MGRNANALPARLPRHWTQQPVSEVVADYCDIRLRRIDGVTADEKAKIAGDVKAVFRNETTIAKSKEGLSPKGLKEITDAVRDIKKRLVVLLGTSALPSETEKAIERLQAQEKPVTYQALFIRASMSLKLSRSINRASARPGPSTVAPPTKTVRFAASTERNEEVKRLTAQVDEQRRQLEAKDHALATKDELLRSKDDKIEELNDEVEKLRSVAAQLLTNIVHAFGYRGGPESAQIMMEKLDGTLRDLAKNAALDEAQIACILKPCLTALADMHECEYVHCDVKSENIMFSADGALKLGDFGSARKLPIKNNECVGGTVGFRAPEVLGRCNYSGKLDVFSMGAVAVGLKMGPKGFLNGGDGVQSFELGKLAWQASREKQSLIDALRRAAPGLLDDASPAFVDFLSKALEYLPRERPTARQLLGHEFLRDAEHSTEHLRAAIAVAMSQKKVQADVANSEVSSDVSNAEPNGDQRLNVDEELVEALRLDSVSTAEERSFVSDECAKSFSRRDHLTTHRRIHTGEKHFDCHACGKSFTRRDYLTIHQRSHTGEKPYGCDECGKRFAQKSQLNSHRQAHSGEERFECDKCAMKFSQRAALKVHQRVHVGEKPFDCDECGKSFSHKAHLTDHRRIHTGEKPFGCEECGKTFSQKANLSKHRLVHTGERSFDCGECPKQFKRLEHLQRHQLAHADARPFPCGQCPQRFTRRDHLKRHLRVHAREPTDN